MRKPQETRNGGEPLWCVSHNLAQFFPATNATETPESRRLPRITQRVAFTQRSSPRPSIPIQPIDLVAPWIVPGSRLFFHRKYWHKRP